MFFCVPDVPYYINDPLYYINESTSNESTRIKKCVWEKVARKLAMVEADLERAEERAEQGEKYVASPDYIKTMLFVNCF